ncbi:MAG: VWA domain-containing protein, partial [Aggregatilineales bacterium]
MPDKQSYDLIDLFDICIERIAAGEAIDNILADYPDAADDLRALLQTGQLVYQAQITELELNISEVDSAKASTRQRLEDRLQKPKNNIVVMDKPKRRRRNTGWMSAAAGVAILIFGMMIGIIFTDQTSQNRTLDVTRTAIADLNVTTGVDGTAIAQVMTDESQLLATSSPIPAPMTGTLNPLQQTIVAQQSIQSTATPIPVTNPTDVINAAANITATADIDFMATQNAPAADVQQTQPAFATQRAGSVATMTPVPSQTAPPTRTPAPMGTFQPTLTPTDIDFGCPPGDCGNPPVSTSVASMNATPEAQLRFSGVQLTATSIAIQEMSLATQTSIASLLTTPVPGTQVAVLTVATQNFDSVQLDPLRAGEIDDNAEWDRYTEYRRNYLSQFANTVRDIDVRNRRIIQVVDDNGLPVQGATVRITALDRLISETRTYATGMTQFFPKLDAVSQGIDVFDVTVEYRNFRTFASLDLERPGDVVTIGMDFALNSASRAVQPLDILFLIDATSSMDDEIAQLQNNITVIAGQVDALPGNLDVRYGLVYYHDHSVPGQTVKQSGFTRDVNEFQTALNNLRTDSTNNNDWAEALNEGLYTTLTQMDWHDESVKL